MNDVDNEVEPKQLKEEINQINSKNLTNELDFEKNTATEKRLEEQAQESDDVERETIAQDGIDFETYHITLFPDGHGSTYSHQEMKEAFINARKKPRRIIGSMWSIIHKLFGVEGFNDVVKSLQKQDGEKRDRYFRENGKVITLTIEEVEQAQVQGITQENLVKAEFLQKHKLELSSLQYKCLEYIQSTAQRAYVITLPANYLEVADGITS